MKAQLNFYDETLDFITPINLKKLRELISNKYSLDPTDTDELIIFYNHLKDGKKFIHNEADYVNALNYFSSSKNLVPILYIEVSESSKLFLQEFSNNFQPKINEEDYQERQRKEILENESKIKDELAKKSKEEEELLAQMKRDEEEKRAIIEATQKIREKQKEMEDHKKREEEAFRIQEELKVAMLKKEQEEKAQRLQKESELRNKLKEIEAKIQIERSKNEIKPEEVKPEVKAEPKPVVKEEINLQSEINPIELLEEESFNPYSNAISQIIHEPFHSVKDEILKKTLTESSKLFGKMKLQNSVNLNASQKVEPLSVHMHVACDGCGVSPIKGIRYKCAICDDFDYCETCEEANATTHKHPFLKIRDPSLTSVKIACVDREDFPDFVNMEKIQPQNQNYYGVYDQWDHGCHKKRHWKRHNKNHEQNFNHPNQGGCPYRNRRNEKKQEDGFMGKIKNGFGEIPNKIKKAEEIIRNKFNNMMNKPENQKKKYEPELKKIRDSFFLHNISDEQILEALAQAKGDIDAALGLLF